MGKIEIKSLSEIPQSRNTEIETTIKQFMALKTKYAEAIGVKKFSVPYLNKRSEKEKLGIKAVTRSGKVYLINTNLA
jgi:lipid A disaccharide synthetase